MQETYNRLNKFSEDMKLHYASPNQDMVVEILQLDAAILSSLSTQQLSQYVFVLGQYLVMLKYNENLKNVDAKSDSKIYEFHLNKTKLGHKNVPGKTEKERNTWVLLNVPEVKELYERAQISEMESSLIEGMTKPVEHLMNAIKKELSIRYGE